MHVVQEIKRTPADVLYGIIADMHGTGISAVVCGYDSKRSIFTADDGGFIGMQPPKSLKSMNQRRMLIPDTSFLEKILPFHGKLNELERILDANCCSMEENKVKFEMKDFLEEIGGQAVSCSYEGGGLFDDTVFIGPKDYEDQQTGARYHMIDLTALPFVVGHKDFKDLVAFLREQSRLASKREPSKAPYIPPAVNGPFGPFMPQRP